MPYFTNNNKKLKYTDMAIYIDKNAYRDDLTEVEKETIFKYCYFICYMLAKVNKYFPLDKVEDYDEFSLYASIEIYSRIFNRDREPLVSVLNFTKGILYFLKVNWVRANYKQVIDKEYDKDVDDYTLKTKLQDIISNQYSNEIKYEIISLIENLSSIIDNVLKETPYKKDNYLMYKLKLSCLISFIKSITLKENVKDKMNIKANFYKSISKLYSKERENCITLWHLDDEWRDFITLQLNKIRKKFIQETNDIIQGSLLDSSILDAIIMASNGNQKEGEDYYD